MYNGIGGSAITSTQQLYIYGQSGVCTAETTLQINIDTLILQTQANASDCNSVTLPALLANNSYYTQTGGPTGTGVQLNAGDVPDLSGSPLARAKVKGLRRNAAWKKQP